MKIKKSIYTRIFEIAAYGILIITAVVCVVPFLFIVAGSLTPNEVVIREGYSFIPKEVSLEAYRMVFRYPKDILQAYYVTTYCTVIGTVVGLAIIALAGYVLSRKEFRYRNTISFLIYFTSIFGGGMVPWYYMYSGLLQMKGTMAVLWIPGLMSPFLIVLMRTFVTGSLPSEITEAAKIDGAGHGTVFLKVVLPLLKPGLATVGLFLALGYWNDWYRSSLFSIDSSTWELQFYLYNVISKAQAATGVAAQAGISITDLPSETMKLAMAVVVTGPILLLYPFVQRYFIAGITVGAVKG